MNYKTSFLSNGIFIGQILCKNCSGTAIYANLWAVMHDKYYWKDPNEFRPERFLDNDGQFRRDDRCVPFSLGKRYCIGQVK